MQLEIISRSPANPGSNPRVPLLFVHGAFGGAWMWDEHFLPYFAEKGYEVHALSLRGHGESEPQDDMHLVGLADYVDDLREAVRYLGTTPVLVGHSLGGVIVQKWLQTNRAPGAVLMGSGPPHGMLPSTLGMLLQDPVLVAQLALAQTFGPAAATVEAMRKTLFSDTLPAAKVRRHLERGSPESLRVGLELLWPAFPGPTWNRAMPMLVLGAEKDFFVSPTMVKATAQVYGTRAQIIPNLAHAMMLETLWQVVADRILHWLEEAVAPQELPMPVGENPGPAGSTSQTGS
jgi:pimeloyl-ACP methyl ester carboxylesterase